MICQNCEAHPATFQIVEKDGDNLVCLFLCEDCAFCMGLTSEMNTGQVPGTEISVNPIPEVKLLSYKDDNDPVCPHCGLAFTKYLQTGQKGCVHCLETYQSALDQIVWHLYNTTNNHAVKQKLLMFNSNDLVERIKKLETALSIAVAVEDFEKAAEIRDELNMIKLNYQTIH